MKIARISWIFDIFTIVNSSHYRYLLIWIWIYPILEIKTPWNMDNQTTIWRKETVIILSFYLNVLSFMKLGIHWYTYISKLLTTKKIKNQGGGQVMKNMSLGSAHFLLYNKFACCICRLVLEAMDGRFLNDSYHRPCPKAGPDAAPKQPVSQRTLKVIILLYGRLCFILRPKVCKGIIYHDKNHQSK